VGTRDQLGQGCRATRKQHRGDLARIGIVPGQPRRNRLIRQGRGDHRPQVDLARTGFAGNEDMAQGQRVGAYFARHLAVIEVADAIGNYVGRGARGLEEVADFAVAMGAQRHHRNRADARQRKVGQHELGAVGQLQHHAVE